MGNRQAKGVREPLQGRGYWLLPVLLGCIVLGWSNNLLAAESLLGDPDEPSAGSVAEEPGKGAVASGAPAREETTSSPHRVAQCRLLREMAGELENPLEQAQALLAAAECSLARECAGPISAIWAGRVPGRTESARQLSLFSNQAKEDLARVSEILDARGDSDGDEADMNRRTRERVEIMRAFAEMFDAIGSTVSAEGTPTTRPASDDPIRKRLISACHALAPCLDISDEGVVDAARFYQGLAYRLAGRPERTVVVIKPVLAKPRFACLGLMSRLEYCRAMGMQGEYAAAVVLCLRLGKLSEEWFSDEPVAAQAAAQATVLAVRVEIMQQWVASLEAAGEKEEAGELRRQLQELVKKQGTPDSKSALLELEKAIPGAS